MCWHQAVACIRAYDIIHRIKTIITIFCDLVLLIYPLTPIPFGRLVNIWRHNETIAPRYLLDATIRSSRRKIQIGAEKRVEN